MTYTNDADPFQVNLISSNQSVADYYPLNRCPEVQFPFFFQRLRKKKEKEKCKLDQIDSLALLVRHLFHIQNYDDSTPLIQPKSPLYFFGT